MKESCGGLSCLIGREFYANFTLHQATKIVNMLLRGGWEPHAKTISLRNLLCKLYPALRNRCTNVATFSVSVWCVQMVTCETHHTPRSSDRPSIGLPT
jgi:hypothetical protein